MNSNPLVSVIIPVYNDEKHILETIQSVKNQTQNNWECIIINDGSTDHSKNLIEKNISNDFRFKFIDKENSGVSDTRNIGIRSSTGIYILPLDSDDLISKTYLEKAINVFALKPETTLVYCKAEYFGNKKGIYKLPIYNYDSLIINNSIFPTAMFKKTDFLTTNGYDQNLVHGLEDWEFWIQLLNKKSIIVKLNEVHYYYRIRENSRNSVHNDTQKIKDIHNYIFEKHKLKYYDLLFNNEPKLYALKNVFENQEKFELVKKSIFYKFYKIVREIRKPFMKKL